MLYNSVSPNMVAKGPQTYSSPYYTPSCSCGVGVAGKSTRENFNGAIPVVIPVGYPQAPTARAGAGCTLTATGPPAACCNGSPMHCSGSSCGGMGSSYFNINQAYGS